jgi:GNAT superfamily N-acetyltransferase
MPETYWTLRLGEPDETARLLELVRAVHGDRHPELNRAYWEWRYLNPGAFRADIMLAEHEGRPISIQPLAVFDYQWGTDRLKGAMYTGVMTHPEHRRRGVFRAVIAAADAHAAQRGAQFVTTMPNDASLPGFQRFGEWEYPGPIPLFLKVVNGAAVLRPRLGRGAGRLLGWAPRVLGSRRPKRPAPPLLETELAAVIPGELDEVAERFAQDCAALGIRRTASYWTWRYTSKPGAAYRTLLARRNGCLAGAVVTTVERRFRIDMGLIVDLVAQGGLPTVRALLRAAEQDLAARGLGLLTCQATSPLLQRALCAEGYLCPSARWLPKRFHFVYRLTGVPGLLRTPNRLSDWHLTFGDSDNA